MADVKPLELGAVGASKRKEPGAAVRIRRRCAAPEWTHAPWMLARGAKASVRVWSQEVRGLIHRKRQCGFQKRKEWAAIVHPGHHR